MFKLIKFCVVGGINTLISLLVFYVLNKQLGINYILSSVIGYATGMLNSYILNKKWTFSDKDKRVFPQFVKFSFVNLISLGINLTAMYVLVDILNIDSMVSQLFATVFSTASNYAGSRLLVFRELTKT